MKRLLFILLISIQQLFAQDGAVLSNHIKKQFVITKDGHTVWGLEYLPDDFNTTTKKYPTLVFFHGRGETGSNEAGLLNLLQNGPSAFIAKGEKMQFVNPNTGLLEKFIVIATQDQYYSPQLAHVSYILKNDPVLKNRIGAIFYTGLSAGGAQTMAAVTNTQKASDSILGIIPMSSCGYTKGNLSLAKNVNVWAFHGLSDDMCAYQFTKEFVDSVTTYSAGKTSVHWTQEPAGHGPWNTFYNPAYREMINGKLMNIYEWCLSLQNTGIVITPTLPKIVFTITIDGKTYTVLDNKTWY